MFLNYAGNKPGRLGDLRKTQDGQAASIYKQTARLKNPLRPPGDWKLYDVIYTAPRFKEDSSLFSPGRVTLIINGVLVQNNTTIVVSRYPYLLV